MDIAGGSREVCAPEAFVLSQSWKIGKKKNEAIYTQKEIMKRNDNSAKSTLETAGDCMEDAQLKPQGIGRLL